MRGSKLITILIVAGLLVAGCGLLEVSGSGGGCPGGGACAEKPAEASPNELSDAASSPREAGEKTAPAAIPYRQAGLYFPHVREPASEYMTALGGGTLFVEDGCIRMGDPAGSPRRGHADVVVWPYGYSLSRQRGEVFVLNAKGEVAARIGEEVRMGGGQILKDGLAPTPERERRAFEEYREKMGVPERCRGSLWVASPGVRVVKRG